MKSTNVGVYAKIGALLFVIWHIWVAYAAIEEKLQHGNLWKMFIGGELVPFALFNHAKDEVTVYAHEQLLLNFALDVGGYGVLGLFVAYKIWTEGSWFAYAIGVICIGIADLAFLLLMVYPGKVIEMKFEVLLGPIIWFLAILVTPFGHSKDDGVKKRQ